MRRRGQYVQPRTLLAKPIEARSEISENPELTLPPKHDEVGVLLAVPATSTKCVLYSKIITIMVTLVPA